MPSIRRSLQISAWAREHEAFAKFFHAPAAYFDSLNSRAAIRFAGDREQSKPRPELSALNSLAEFLNSPEDEGDCAPLFFRVVAPTSEGYSGYLARHVEELIRTVAWHEQQVKSRDSAIKEQKQFIRKLESSKTYLVDQLEQHAQALDQQKCYIARVGISQEVFHRAIGTARPGTRSTEVLRPRVGISQEVFHRATGTARPGTRSTEVLHARVGISQEVFHRAIGTARPGTRSTEASHIRVGISPGALSKSDSKPRRMHPGTSDTEGGIPYIVWVQKNERRLRVSLR